MKRIITLIFCCIVAFNCKSPEVRKPITHSSGTFIKESAERNKQLLEKEIELIKTVIEKKDSLTFVNSEYGFWFTYITKVEKDTVTPLFGDIVNFDYNIKDLSDNLIYSKAELKNRNYAMDKEEIFTGLREGLKLLKPGESATFIFPSSKAFGYYGDEDKIGTNIPLICDVTVNSITKTINK